jgi:hypothetical protein
MNMKKSYYFRGQKQKKINTKFTLIQEVMRSISNLLTKNVCMMDKRAKKRTTYMVTTRTTKVVPKA